MAIGTVLRELYEGESRREPEAALSNLPDTTPPAWDDLEHLADDVLRRAVSTPANRSAVLVLDLPAALFELKDAHVDAFQNIERLKAGDDDWDPVAGGDWLVFLVAHNSANMAGGNKALYAVGRRIEQRTNCRRHEHMRDQHREIPYSL